MTRVGIDVDGVIAEFTAGFTAVAQSMGLVPAAWDTAHQASWNFDFDASPVWANILGRQNWWMGLEPIVTREEVALLNEVISEHDVYFITSRVRGRGLSAECQTKHWLDGIGVHVTHRPSVIATRSGTKGALMKALNIEVAIDDSLENLHDMRKHGILAVARSQPYNVGWNPRVSSLGLFLDGCMGRWFEGESRQHLEWMEADPWAS